MQPYQKASQENLRQKSRPFEAAKGIAERVMPFLSNYIPFHLAAKGLGKIDSRLGDFAQTAQEFGHDVDDIKGFIKDKIEVKQNEPVKKSGNIIEQYSPELFSFLDQKIKGGLQPIQAAALAQNDKKFSNLIKQLTKDHKTDWSSIIQSVFGEGMAAAEERQPQQQSGGLDPQVAQILAQGQQLLQRFSK